ncbi:MAG TPA: hypothetical protein VF212_11940 [Longimicrobiales bacterium]
MALTRSTLADALADVFQSRPSTTAEAGLRWARAYHAYASGALSAAGSLPVNAAAGFGILVGAFTGALAAMDAEAAAAAITAGVMVFWQSMAWAGPTAAGTTAAPGNFALVPALAAIFADSGGGAREKADRLADAFDAGARMVIVVDVPFVQPAPPIVGPIQ